MPLCVCVLLSGKQEHGEFFFYLLLSSLQHKIIVLRSSICWGGIFCHPSLYILSQKFFLKHIRQTLLAWKSVLVWEVVIKE